MKIDPKKLEQIDRTAQSIVGDAVTAVNPLAGQVLDWKMNRYNKDTYGDEAKASRDGAIKVGAKAFSIDPDEMVIPKKPTMPLYLAPLAPLNPLYKNPKLQQAARDQGNWGHDLADDYGRKDAPTDDEIDKANKSISASESRAGAIRVGAKPKAFIDPLTVGIVAGNIAIASGAAWGAGKVGDWIGDRIVGDDKPKKATEQAQAFATSTIDILPALGTLGAVGVATYAGSKLIGAGVDALTKKKKKVAKTADPHMDNMNSDVTVPGFKVDPNFDNYAMSEDDDDSEEYAESRKRAVSVGAKPKEFALNVSEAEYKKLQANMGTSADTPAITSAAPVTKNAGKSVTVDNDNWGARADQVVWEGVKATTGTKDNPKKTVFFGEPRVIPDGPEEAKKISAAKRLEGVVPGAWGGVAYIGNTRVGVYDKPYGPGREMAESRANAIKVGAKPKEFFDPINAAIAGAVALPVAYGVGKAVDYAYDVVTGKKMRQKQAQTAPEPNTYAEVK